MAEDKGKEEEKFDFTPEGEELGYFTLDQALLLARQTAQQDSEPYRLRLNWDEIVWSEVSSEERGDTFRIVLQFRRPGREIREEQTGEEEFVFNEVGALVFRQVLAWPEGGEPPEEDNPPTLISTPTSSFPPDQEQVVVGDEGAIANRQGANPPTEASNKPSDTDKKKSTPAYLMAIGVLGSIMIVVAVLVAILSPGGDGMQVTAPLSTDTSLGAATTTAEATPTPTVTLVKPATSVPVIVPNQYSVPVVKASVLANEWQKREIAAEVTYLDKTFVITGKITKVEKKGGLAEVNLDGGSANGDIVCKFQPSQFSSIVEFAEGQQVDVQGRIIGVPGMYNVVVEECTVPNERGISTLAPDNKPETTAENNRPAAQSVEPLGKIAFVHWGTSAFPERDPGIYVMNSDGSNQINLTKQDRSAERPSWSPDGTRIVFTSARDVNREIYAMNADGSNQTNLTKHPGEDTFPSWSPDGTRIVFTSARYGNREIYAMNADGSNQVNLTQHSEPNWMPTWSPDGTRIAFVRERTGAGQDIYLMNADGSNQTNLSGHEGSATEPSWSPDGTRIAFTYNEMAGYQGIYVINVDGSNLTNLTPNAEYGNTDPSWSPDGTQIAFTLKRGNGTIYVMNSDGSNQTNLTQIGRNDLHPSWAPIILK